MRRIKSIIKDVFIGAAAYDIILDLQRKMFQNECLLMLAVMGDRLGLPTACYYRFKILPYWVKRLKQFNGELLREKDFLEKV